MEALKLPLVESIVDSCQGVSLANVKIIGAQHILETTHAMFRSLYKLGLKPENVALIGKCYSTCEAVFAEMIADGITISQDSLMYDSHRPYDEQYEQNVNNFLASRLDSLFEEDVSKIIVLDDGGKCINFLSRYLTDKIQVVAIEQTSAGYEAIKKNSHLSFPVVNVAKSPAKLVFESPLIAQAAAERLYWSLQKRQIRPEKALIIGGGAIGKAMKKKLEFEMNVSIFDQQQELSCKKEFCFPDSLSEYPLIVGCTGRTSIPASYHSFFQKDSVLVSVSSSDREFDAYELRKKINQNSSCHRDLNIGNLLLINSGFPVNFDGDRENIHPDLIQLTIALITAGILQAMQIEEIRGWIVPLCKKMEKKIVDEFAKLKIPYVTTELIDSYNAQTTQLN